MGTIRATSISGAVEVCLEEVGGRITTGAVDVVVFEIIAHFRHIRRLQVENQI